MQQGSLDLSAGQAPPAPVITQADVIAEVAKRHKQILTKGDPVLMVLTGLEVIGTAMVDRLVRKLTESEDQIASGTAQQIAASQAYIEKAVNAGGEFLSRRLASGSSELAKAFAVEAAAVLEPFRAQLEADRRAVVRSERRAAIAAAISSIGAAGTVTAVAILLLRM